MKLTCPACGQAGEIKGTDQFFEPRGQWPDGHQPVRRCRACGAGIVVGLRLRNARATLIDPEVWETMQLHYDAAIARAQAGLHDTAVDRRASALDLAADRIDDELQAAPIDEYFTMMLMSFAWGGLQALELFCNSVEDPSELITETRALEFVAAVAAAPTADRALRAATWIVGTRTLTAHWPDRLDEVMEVARMAMPAGDEDFESLSELAALTIAQRTSDGDDGVAALARFSRLSLEWVIVRAVGARPASGELAIPTLLWAQCIAHGHEAGMQRLSELEAANPHLAE